MVKIVEFKGQYRITLPKDLIESKGWTKGTKIAFYLDAEGSICLRKIEQKENIKEEVAVSDDKG